jgi:hypothetical protein
MHDADVIQFLEILMTAALSYNFKLSKVLLILFIFRLLNVVYQ